MLSDPASQAVAHALLGYTSSKAALNAVTLLYANKLRGDGIRVNAVNTGYVATDLNDHRGVLTVQQGAEMPVRLVLLGGDGPTGMFVDQLSDQDIGTLPW